MARHPTSGSWPQHTARALGLLRSLQAPLVIRGDPCQWLEPRHDQHPVSADHDDTPTSPRAQWHHPVTASLLVPTPELICNHGFRAVSVSSKDSTDTVVGKTSARHPTTDAVNNLTFQGKRRSSKSTPRCWSGKGVPPGKPRCLHGRTCPLGRASIKALTSTNAHLGLLGNR
jgi:hypothetical protein